jgi:hypothetical protein
MPGFKAAVLEYTEKMCVAWPTAQSMGRGVAR